MKLEKAFSKDLQKLITADVADFHFSKKDITSKFAFTCPDQHCDAQVTCANLDRPKAMRKRDPYYKIVGDHSEDCVVQQDIRTTLSQPVDKGDIYSAEDKPIAGTVRMNLRPLSSIRPNKDPDPNANINNEPQTRTGRDNGEKGERVIQRSKVLSSLIDMFLNNEDIVVQLPGNTTLHISELFIEIKGQDTSEFEDDYRIYYGKGWINKSKNDNGYVIRFANTLKCNEIEARPSFFIPVEALENANHGKFKSATFEKLTNNYLKNIYILSETGPYTKNEYINFWLDAPQYMDYRFK